MKGVIADTRSIEEKVTTQIMHFTDEIGRKKKEEDSTTGGSALR